MHRTFLPLLLLIGTTISKAAEPVLPLIPWPKSVSVSGGYMELTESSRVVYADDALAPLATVLATEIEEVTRLKLPVQQGQPKNGDILLKITSDRSLQGERYKVGVAGYVVAEAKNYQAVAMASVTVLQAIKESKGFFGIPKMVVKDEPHVGYRGFMVDVARQEHSIKSLKEMVDMCRLYKIRIMQIHFNDDQAYTLPSKAFPVLNEKSPYRYTWDEVVDLVDYADKRGVTIIPEIETPAHASAMINAMPELFSSPAGGVVNFAREEVWEALVTIINESCELFPSAPYIHLGADEANIWGLPGDPEFAAAIKKHKVGDIEGLFNHYINHLDEAIRAKGKKTIVWEGFNYGKNGEAKMNPEVAVMMFDNAKSAQGYADAGHDVINASWNPTYIVGFEGRGFGAPAHWIYQWDKSQFHGYINYPMTWSRTQKKPLVDSPKVIGGQLCSWEMLEWREIPRIRFRIAPFADRMWNPESDKDFAHFEQRYAHTDVVLDHLLAQHEAPAIPTDVGASDGYYQDRIRVGWRDGGNYPRGFALYRNTEDDPKSATLISDDLPKTTTLYVDQDVKEGETYHYWVKARNNWGWSDFSEVATGTTGNKPLASAYEPFDYKSGAELVGLDEGSGFTSAWESTRDTGPLTIAPKSLEYSGVPSKGGALKVDHTINEATELPRTFEGTLGHDMTEIWASYLIRGDKVALGWQTANLNGGRRFGKHSYNGIGIFYDTSVFMEEDTTYLLVLYVDCRPGRDNMYLWVNPPADTKPSTDDYAAIWEMDNLAVGNEFRFHLSGTESGKYLIDEVRIGSTWEEAIGKSGTN
ncbi:MAG: family 20 glycosylhydrolase [Verrucomicrobiota bacterium]